MRYRISHSIETDEATFWNLFFDKAVNEAMFRDELRFSVYRVISLDKRPDGTIIQKSEAAPPVELPAAVKRVVGDVTSYTEAGRFDPATKRYTADVIPSAASDKVRTRVEIWVEPRGDKRVERIVDVDNSVKIFGVGKVAEKFIEQQTRKTYDDVAVFMNRWIRTHGL